MIRRILILALIISHAMTISSLAKKEWEELKGTNFIIYYRDHGVPQDFVETVMASAEEEMRRVSENLGLARYQGWGWDNRASIYIFADGEDYVNNAGQSKWSEGAAVVATKTIRTYPQDNGFFDSVLPHELGHIIFHEIIGPEADVPLWFDEGVAMYVEKSRRLGASSMVKKAIKNGQFIPLNQLMDMRLYGDAEDSMVQLFYAESASAVNFLMTEFGSTRFHKLCLELKDNTRFTDAIPKVYMRIKDIGDLNKMWVRHLEEE